MIGNNDQVPSGYQEVTPARMRADSSLRHQVSNAMDTWGLLGLGCGGKFDGSGYGNSVHNSHGSECCGAILVAAIPST
jgi:hypothetical protein